MGNPTRRAVLTGCATAAVIGTVGTSGVDGASETGERWTIDGSEHGGSNLQVTVRPGEPDSRGGSVIESIDGFGAPPLVRDLHAVVWDEDRGYTRTPRDDAEDTSVTESEYSAHAPEVQLRDQLPFTSDDHDDYVATINQNVLVAKDRPAVLTRAFCSMHLPRDSSRGAPDSTPAAETNNTLYTVCTPTLGESTVEGRYEEGSTYDFLVVDDDSVATAIAFEHRDYRSDDIVHTRRFDGQRFGHRGVASGPDRSAWADIYEAEDGWIEANTEQVGDLDAGFGCFIGADHVARWSVCLGFGESPEVAKANARNTIDAGYRVERAAYTNP